ncbi:MAG: alpha/beta hydrolase [Pirellulales bacterium]
MTPQNTWLAFYALSTLVLTAPTATHAAPEQISLWPGGAPGFEARRDEPEEAQDYWVRNIHNPSITAFLPPADKATGAAVIVVPGGGHRELVFDAEGCDAAEYLNQLGVAAFVLKYRLAREKDSPYKIETHVRQDAYRALRTVRSRAAEWHLDPQRIGILGFSAGGEVAALVAYESGDGDPQAADPIDRVNGRPDFQIVVYPGPLGIPKDKVPADSPPLLLICANDDRGHIEPTIDLLTKYRAAGAPVEAHIYSHGGHAFNMGRRSELATLQGWPARMADWLRDNGWLDPDHKPAR